MSGFAPKALFKTGASAILFERAIAEARRASGAPGADEAAARAPASPSIALYVSAATHFHVHQLEAAGVENGGDRKIFFEGNIGHSAFGRGEPFPVGFATF